MRRFTALAAALLLAACSPTNPSTGTGSSPAPAASAAPATNANSATYAAASLTVDGDAKSLPSLSSRLVTEASQVFTIGHVGPKLPAKGTFYISLLVLKGRAATLAKSDFVVGVGTVDATVQAYQSVGTTPAAQDFTVTPAGDGKIDLHYAGQLNCNGGCNDEATKSHVVDLTVKGLVVN